MSTFHTLPIASKIAGITEDAFRKRAERLGLGTLFKSNGSLNKKGRFRKLLYTASEIEQVKNYKIKDPK